MSADQVIFNSSFNKNSFLDNINTFLNIQSDYKTKGLRELIQPKCMVLYFPIKFNQLSKESFRDGESSELHLVWPHRWEHDKENLIFIINQQ